MSEDGSADGRPPAESADAVRSLSLPFVIGTPEFLADDHCGLYPTEDISIRRTMETTMSLGNDSGIDDRRATQMSDSERYSRLSLDEALGEESSEEEGTDDDVVEEEE